MQQCQSVFLELREIITPAGVKRKVSLFAKGGAVGIGQLLDTGDLEFIRLRRIRTNRSRNGIVALVDRSARLTSLASGFGQIASASSSNAAARRKPSWRASTPSS
jgi:hypothetical protein